MTEEGLEAVQFVFVSYARPDREYVTRLAAHLTARGIPNWFDDALVPSERWSSTIEHRLRESMAVVVVVSLASVDSRWVERELLLAEELQKPVFPLHLDGTRWWRLSDLQAVDVDDRQLPPSIFVQQLRRAVAVEAPIAPDRPVVPEGAAQIARCLDQGDLEGADRVASALLRDAAGGAPIATPDAARRLPEALLNLLCWIYRSSGTSLRDRPFVTGDAFNTSGTGLSGLDPITGRSILLGRLDELSG